MLLRALALGSLLYAAAACAQWSGTLAAVSDYRFRGISLSDGKPAAQLTVDYDDPRGWYGGAFVSTVAIAGSAATTVQGIAYAGLVTAVGNDWHWDLGASGAAFSAGHEYSYAEIYTGLASRDLTARVHYSPDYFGRAQPTFYGEVDATHALGGPFTLFGHVGVLIPSGRGTTEYGYRDGPRNPVDARIGIAADAGRLHWELAWVGTNGTGTGYPVDRDLRRNTGVVSVSSSF